MTYIAKPRLHHPSLVKNKAGFTRRDYEGAVSTLCAGCGHDSISAAIIQACILEHRPHRAVADANSAVADCVEQVTHSFLQGVRRCRRGH